MVQLGRLLRREVGKFNGGTSCRASDTTPERSSQASERTPKVMSSRSSRGLHIEPSSAAGERPSSAHSGHSNSLSVSRSARGGSSGTVADRGGGERGPSSSAYEYNGSRKASNGKHEGPEPSPSEYGDQPRRRSDPENDIRGRRAGNGICHSSSARGASSASAATRGRRGAEPPSSSSTCMYDVDRHAESSEYKRVAPGEEPPNGPPAFWLCSEEGQSGSTTLPRRLPSRQAVECQAASLRRKAGSGASGTTGSTRATPPGSGPGRSEITRSDSSRRTSGASRNTPPRLAHGPSGGSSGNAHWDHHEGGLVNAKGPSDAAVASPRAGPPQLAMPSPPERSPHARTPPGENVGSRRQGRGDPVWLGPDDADKAHQADMGGSYRGLRETASSGARHDAHSLSSLDDVLREMKAMLRSNGEVADPRDDGKAQERMRHASGSSKGSSKQAAQKGVRGATRGTRGADSTGADDRSPSVQRASSHRARQRSHHDELDFATCEPQSGHALPRGTPPRGTLPRSSTPPRSNTRGTVADAPTPPWAESRKPLESLQPEDNTSPAPLAPWHESRRSGSVRNLTSAEQEWKTLQSNFHAAIGTHGGAKVRGSGGSHRHATRSGSTKRTSENHAANSMSGLGFMY